VLVAAPSPRRHAVVLATVALLVASPPAIAGTGGTGPPPRNGGTAPGPEPAPPPQRTVDGMPDIPYAAEIAQAAARHGLDPLLLAALVRQESGFDPDVTSRTGARGLTQLMPGTARELGLVVDHTTGVDERVIPERALDAGARYLRIQIDRFRSLRLALAAYNAGPRAVRRHRGVPPYRETRTYVRAVLRRRAAYARQVSTGS
jgi:soluble lytic murein transglycosylase-like protein